MGPLKRDKTGRELSPEQAVVAAMIADAKARGLELTGPNGVLKLFIKSVLETALRSGLDQRAERQPVENRDLGRRG